MQKQNIIIILGPTAVGKSDLAVSIAKKFGGEIISADSRQVYKGLNIGTGKITKYEMKGIRHYLLDITNPKRRFNVVNYVSKAKNAIKEIVDNKKIPIVCGGSGFYIHALVDGISIPDVPPDEALRKRLANLKDADLLKILKKLDLKRYETIDKKNTRRIIRSIEVATKLGHVPPIKITNNYNPIYIGLKLESSILKERISSRLKKRIKAGMIEESKKLHAQKLSYKRMTELGLEYKYLAMYLQNHIKKNEMIEKLETEIWHYAKRQMTWFKKDKRIIWFYPHEKDKIENRLANFLGL